MTKDLAITSAVTFCFLTDTAHKLDTHGAFFWADQEFGFRLVIPT